MGNYIIKPIVGCYIRHGLSSTWVPKIAHWAGFLPAVEMTKNQVISSAGWYYKKAQFDFWQKMLKITRAGYRYLGIKG
jgi:hypothetical protein